MKVSLLIQFKLSCSASSARDAGTLRPRCSYALRVTQRPRGVRVRKPSCMRYGSYTSQSVTDSSPMVAASVSMPTGPHPRAPLRHRGAHPRDGRGQDRKRRAAGRRAAGEGHSIGLIRRFVGERATNETGIVSCCPNFIFFSVYFRKYLTKPCKYRYNAVW